jgi:hypothetical protein
MLSMPLPVYFKRQEAAYQENMFMSSKDVNAKGVLYIHSAHISFTFVYLKSKLMRILYVCVYVSFLRKIQMITRLPVEARQFQKSGGVDIYKPIPLLQVFKIKAMKPRL